MTAKIHHATKARANKLGFDIGFDATGEEVTVGVNGQIFGQHSSGSIALKQAEDAVLEKFGQDEEGERDQRIIGAIDAAGEEASEEAEEEEEDSGKSVIKKAYKKAYRPFKNTCGDELAAQIRQHLTHTVKVDGKSVKRIDVQRMKQFARANGVWDARYDDLNIGMQRMNIANRLRHKVKGGYEIQWV